MASETHIFTPNLLNEFRLGFNRVSIGSFQENLGRNLNAKVGLPQVSTNPRDSGLSLVSITGYSPIGDESHNPQHSARTSYQILDTVSHVHGRHLLKAGVDFRWLQQNAYRDEMARGFISFLGFTGNALAEMLQGFPSLTGVAHLDNHQHLRTYSSHFFVQDTWRFHPDLTLSVGLRYEYTAPPVDARDRANVYDPVRRALAGVGTSGIPRGGYEADRNNWAPRIGLAWRPRGLGAVLRAGYGVYYDQSALASGEGLYFNAPYFDFRLHFPLEQLPLTLYDPFPQNFPVALPSSALAFQRDLRTAYAQHWSFGVQREIGLQTGPRSGLCRIEGHETAPGPRSQPALSEPDPAQSAARAAIRRHHGPGVAREFESPQSPGSLSAEPPAWSDDPGLLHLVEVD